MGVGTSDGKYYEDEFDYVAGSFDKNPLPKPIDQNRPLEFGLQEALDLREDTMRDPSRFDSPETTDMPLGEGYGNTIRKRNEDFENNLLLRKSGRDREAGLQLDPTPVRDIEVTRDLYIDEEGRQRSHQTEARVSEAFDPPTVEKFAKGLTSSDVELLNWYTGKGGMGVRPNEEEKAERLKALRPILDTLEEQVKSKGLPDSTFNRERNEIIMHNWRGLLLDRVLKKYDQLNPGKRSEIMSDETPDSMIPWAQYAMENKRVPDIQQGRVPRGESSGGSGSVAPVRSPVKEPERITDAAIKTSDGKIHLGPNHSNILQRPEFDKLSDADYESIKDGFMTNTGRFVSREDAVKIGRAAEQLDEDVMPVSKYKGKPSLISENFKEGSPWGQNWQDYEDDNAKQNDIGDMFRSWLGMSPTPKTLKQDPPSKDWPTKDDAEWSRSYQRAYADPSESFFMAGAPIKEVSPENVLAWYNKDKDFTPKIRPITKEEAGEIHEQWIAAERSPVSKLGFSPGKVFVTPKAELSLWGAYSPSRDELWYDSTSKSTPIHESIHRGLKLMRDAGVMPELNVKWREETLTRALMLRHFGDVEKGKGSRGDTEIKRAEEAGEGLVSIKHDLDKIEAAAAKYIANKRPRGPR